MNCSSLPSSLISGHFLNYLINRCNLTSKFAWHDQNIYVSFKLIKMLMITSTSHKEWIKSLTDDHSLYTILLSIDKTTQQKKEKKQFPYFQYVP